MTPTETPGGGAPATRVKTCDASGMAMIHRMFRASYAEAPGLVAGVQDGDRAHATLVADHLDLMARMLHAHHEGEDARLWPALDERAPACALHVDRMKRQHRDILTAVDELEAVLPAWRASASTADAAPVLTALERANAALAVHLPDEEASIVPEMEYTLSGAEMAWFAEHGRKSIPMRSTWPALGLIMAAQPDGGEHFLRTELPPPFRWLWHLVGKRSYARYRAALAGA